MTSLSSEATGSLGLWPHLGYAGFRLDRVSERRSEAPAFLARSDMAACLIAGETVILARSGDRLGALFDRVQAERLGGRLDEACLLGLEGEAPRFALPVAPERAAALADDPELRLSDLRTLMVEKLLPPDQLGLLACAKAMLSWHARRTFCSNCAGRLVMAEGGWRRDCPTCGAQHFPRTDPVVIMSIVDGERCLLGRSPRFAPTMWSCLAGFVEPGETFEAAVRREVREEANIRVGAVRYLASQPWPFPMSVMIGLEGVAESFDITIDPVELEGARWFSRAELRSMFEHSHPEGLTVPTPGSIAHHLLRGFVENRDLPPR
ncbi:NAD(+) diphosphatase [Ancylobacter sp. 6x-1]|uniref:NAD(+) diphosphatase n=1 Tax=Ancylobacter crimeensis TaxID=2579147 RepID=A0ABT0D7V3_9HYPH|nr:NAD(+) diphosphatase [Ancylobacter crimeensis]MCK0196016.1 NAD(+) diphosphatase [Ancylobacter crimeensis]